MAYKTEYKIRDAMGIGQSSRTRAVMSGDGRGSPYDPYNFDDLKNSRSGFLNTEPYNTIFEPTLPWDQQAHYQTIRGLNRASIGATAIANFMRQGVENGISLITNAAEWVSNR
ncbi:MAG TPA: hypothetical protein ENJ93_01355 [Chloroflexi bacterium]|nr:hypothetical protein [Chloroflexota bacterium]